MAKKNRSAGRQAVRRADERWLEGGGLDRPHTKIGVGTAKRLMPKASYRSAQGWTDRSGDIERTASQVTWWPCGRALRQRSYAVLARTTSMRTCLVVVWEERLR